MFHTNAHLSSSMWFTNNHYMSTCHPWILITHNDLLTFNQWDELGGCVAVNTHSQVLGYAQSCSRRSVQQSKWESHLFTVSAQVMFLLFFFDIVENSMSIWHIPSSLHIVLKFGILFLDLSKLWVHFVICYKAVCPPIHLDTWLARYLLDAQLNYFFLNALTVLLLSYQSIDVCQQHISSWLCGHNLE